MYGQLPATSRAPFGVLRLGRGVVTTVLAGPVSPSPPPARPEGNTPAESCWLVLTEGAGEPDRQPATVASTSISPTGRARLIRAVSSWRCHPRGFIMAVSSAPFHRGLLA